MKPFAVSRYATQYLVETATLEWCGRKSFRVPKLVGTAIA